METGNKFCEPIRFQDSLWKKIKARLSVRTVQESIDKGRVVEETGANARRNALQTVTLLDAIEELHFDAAIGGARRDEEKARAKERIFSFRDGFGQWEPKTQRPELWNLYNGRHGKGEHFRFFPLSNWTELDIWRYIAAERLHTPPTYSPDPLHISARHGLRLAQAGRRWPRASREK